MMLGRLIVMKKMRMILLFSFVMLVMVVFAGCKSKDGEIKRVRDLDFTVVEDADVPEEVMNIINEKKKQPFSTSYVYSDELYIIVGYGEKATGGYSIAVEDLFLAPNAVYIDTNLIGPSENDCVTNRVTYPYIVVKTEFVDKIIVFN